MELLPSVAVPPPQPARYAYQQGSLWNTGPSGLLGDRRARSLGDILTVTIEIDDKAEMKNTTTRTREGSESAEEVAEVAVEAAEAAEAAAE